MAQLPKAADPEPNLETASALAFPFMVDALGISALGLLIPTSFSLGLRFGGHLVLLVAFGFFLAQRLLASTDAPWFRASPLRRDRRIMATGLGVIIIVTGVVGLVTLASSAALRFQPSTQFLQLLSALDIAWAMTAVMIAAYWLWGRRAALLGGLIVGVVCIISIARYLDAVGFTRRGKWRLDAESLWTYVLPFDMAVAVIAIGLFVYAARKRARVSG
ncbi:MAG: hypothetical protein GY720_12370 [bacterium]|nr:hypothetical protein [bacterium]